mgnify:CR=1 FL=1
MEWNSVDRDGSPLSHSGGRIRVAASDARHRTGYLLHLQRTSQCQKDSFLCEGSLDG